MKKTILVLSVLGLLMFPLLSFGAAQKIFTGTVVGINGSEVIIAAASGARYHLEVGSAQLLRKNGMAMRFSDIFVGDKVKGVGQLWQDNSISISVFTDLSLYTHKGTFSGKISSLNPLDSSFVLDSRTYGQQIIRTNNFTQFSKNGGIAGLNDMVIGMPATVKGVWDRSNKDVTATEVIGSFRLIDIYFIGELTGKNGSAITVVGNGNVIYGVDTGKAQLLTKGGQPAALNTFMLGDTVRVWGKHLSGSVAIVATKVKESTR